MSRMRQRQREPYEVAIQGAWNAVDIYRGAARYLHTAGQADQTVRLLFAANFCQSEVRNGGFHQFFSNPTGVLAPEAAAGFHAMGLAQAGAVLEEAMAFFGSEYPRDLEKRSSALDAMPGTKRDEWDPFVQLDPRFYDALRGENNVDRFIEAANAFVGATQAPAG